MPIYTVEIDGKQYDIEGDREPTEQEARETVGAYSQEEQPQDIGVATMEEPTGQPQQPTKYSYPEVVTKAVADIIPGTRFATSFYSNLLQGSGMGTALDKAQRETMDLDKIQPSGIKQKVLSGLITGGGRLPFYMAGGVGGKALTAGRPIIGGMLGMGGVNAGGELLSGQPKQMGKSFVQGAAQYPLMHGAGALGNIASNALLRKILTGLGFGTIGAVQTAMQGGDAEDITAETLIGFGLGAGTTDTPKLQTETSTKMAETLVNYVLRPGKVTKKYGANPARAVAKEGLWAKNLEELGTKAEQRTQELNEYKDKIKFEGQNANVKVNLVSKKTFSPLLSLYKEYLKAPEAHQGEITHLRNILLGVGRPGGNRRQLEGVSIDKAYEIRDIVKNMTPTGIFDSMSQAKISGALHETYHNIVEAINSSGVSPNLRIVNKRMQDLISLQKAITDASNRNPSPWRTLPLPLIIAHSLKGPVGVGMAIGTFLGETVPGSTLISKLISKKYPSFPQKSMPSGEGGQPSSVEPFRPTQPPSTRGSQPGGMTPETTKGIGVQQSQNY